MRVDLAQLSVLQSDRHLQRALLARGTLKIRCFYPCQLLLLSLRETSSNLDGIIWSNVFSKCVYECICVCKRVCKVALKFSFALVLSHQITIKVSHTIKLGTKKCCGGGSFQQLTVDDGLIMLSMFIHHGSERFCKGKRQDSLSTGGR